MTTTVEKLLDEATAKGVEYAKLYNSKTAGKKSLKAAKTGAMEAMDAFNSALAKATYRAWAKEGDPIRTAVRTLFIPGTKRFKFKVDDADYMTVSIVDVQYEVNLPMMQAVLGAGVFHNPGWFSKCEKLCYLVSNVINEHINNMVLFPMVISDAAKEFDFDGIDPLSDEGVIYALREVYDSILYIDNPDNPGTNIIKPAIRTDKRGNVYSPEWTYIRESMTANGGIGVVNLCNTGRFTSYVLHAMHMSMTNGTMTASYEGDFKMPDSEVPQTASKPEPAPDAEQTAPADNHPEDSAPAAAADAAAPAPDDGKKKGRSRSKGGK